MKKNVVWWIGAKNEQYLEKYGGWEWMDISRKTWEFWCDKHDVLFVPFETPIENDLTKFRINWQKAIFVFDELERRNIDYDQIWLVDATCMIKWDTPNVFKMTDYKFTAWREMDNLRWVYDGIMGYKKFFNDYEFDKQKYFSSGIIIFNKKHREIFKSFKKLYYDNVDKLVELQDKIVRKGTEQVPLNYWLQINNVDMNLDLPFIYKLHHIHRKEMFNYNWQLNDDKIPFFIKYGQVWGFTGLPKDQRTGIMKQTWNLVKHNYDNRFFLNKIENKSENKNTTSHKFKEDIYRIFSDKKYKDMTILELGCHQGNTTRVYAECFGTVIAIERSEHNIQMAKENCKDVSNIKFINVDIYDKNFVLPHADVVHVDAGHTYEEVIYDINRCIDQLDNPIFIFDDYGHEGRTVRDAINDKLSEGILTLKVYIGEDKGYVAANNKVFIGREGVVCNV